MSRGYQADPLAEHAYVSELAALRATVDQADEQMRTLAAEALKRGCRAHVIAAATGRSRATLFRWIRTPT